jgi:hypothetical protein
MKEWKHIQDSGECPDDDLLRQYAAGILQGELHRKVELHLADCDMCNDIVEGMSLVGADDFQKSINTIHQRVDEHSAKSRVVPMRWYAIAASMLLIAGLSVLVYLMLDTSSEPLNLAELRKKEIPNTEQGTIANVSDEQQTVEPVVENSKAESSSDRPQGESLLESAIESVKKSEEDAREEGLAVMSAVDDAVEAAAPVTLSTLKRAGETRNTRSFADMPEAEAKTSAKVALQNEQVGKKRSTEVVYKGTPAVAETDQVATAVSAVSKDEELFFEAKRIYSSKATKAKNLLKPILANAQSPYYRESKLLLAIINEQEKSGSGKLILQELSTGNDSTATKARKLLEQ